MTQEQMNKILASHLAWLNKNNNGERAYLKGMDLSHVDLRGAMLDYADISRANLYGADMTNASMVHADLSDSDLGYAVLYSTKLFFADLSRANLYRCNMRYADLRAAILTGATLDHADIRYADLSGAKVDHACLLLSCGGSHFTCDKQLVYQLLAHVCTLNFRDDEGLKEQIRPFAERSHRAKELGLLTSKDNF